jgi:esterase
MELYYKQHGEGPPLIILHGLLGASGNWHTLSSSVFGQHFTVYAVDQRNHGRSPHSDAFDYPSMVGDLEAFMDARGLDAAHVLGHSMGGKTAMHFALTHPDRVDRLVVVDIAPKPYPARHAVIFDALRSLDLAAYDARSAIDEALAERIASAPIRQFLLKNLSYDSDTSRYGWQMNLEGIYRGYDRINEGIAPGRTFDGPTLFVRGGASDYVEDGDAALIQQLFPRAEIVSVAGAGHWVHAEAPDAFARVVLDFLQAG